MTASGDRPARRVAIVGLGLMGGSIARGLKAIPSPPQIRAISLDPEELEAGRQAGVVDIPAGGPDELLEGCDLVVYATPLSVTLALLAEHLPHLEPDTVVTDVVSLKAPVLDRAEGLGLGGRFVGSHPMVGGTGTGFRHASPDLYRGARVWMVQGSEPGDGVLEAVKRLWESVGARPAPIGAREHDELMAWASHLPQLTANALATVLERAEVGRHRLGSGGRDMTRLAGSAPRMWEDLLRAAPSTLPAALKALEGALAELRGFLEEGAPEKIAAWMEENRRWMEEGR